ncbi:MAG: inositol-3-phosphate synthase, partial [Candidatus Acidiferrales bacterium]
MRKPGKIARPKGRLGVLTPGIGAVSTTFMAGVELVRSGAALPVGSLTQMGTIRLGKRTDGRAPKIQDFVPLASLDDLVFGGWDLFPDTAHEAATKAGVLDANHLRKVQPFLSKIKPMKAAFDQSYVKNLHGEHVKRAKNKFDLAEQLREDIRNFKKSAKVDRTVMVWCASTEIFLRPDKVHQTLATFERAMKENHEAIAPSMLYAYAAIQEGVPFANGAPNLTAELPALVELAREKNVPICGKDFKTGQTLMKTILSPGLKARMIGLHGWFSTNILGNRDGEVLDDPG